MKEIYDLVDAWLLLPPIITTEESVTGTHESRHWFKRLNIWVGEVFLLTGPHEFDLIHIRKFWHTKTLPMLLQEYLCLWENVPLPLEIKVPRDYMNSAMLDHFLELAQKLAKLLLFPYRKPI